MRAEIACRRTIADSLTPRADVGSSRIRTLRAEVLGAGDRQRLALAARQRPDELFGVAHVDPDVVHLLARRSAAAFASSNRLNGPNPTVGSLPRKKFRLMLISGITDRSW